MTGRTNSNKYACLCCGYKTLDEKPGGTFLICAVCKWEDDPVQGADPDYRGGANNVCLREAQKNFQEFGASERELLPGVRRPEINEARDADWSFLD